MDYRTTRLQDYWTVLKSKSKAKMLKSLNQKRRPEIRHQRSASGTGTRRCWRDAGGNNERNHLRRLCPEQIVVGSHIREVAPRIVLLPELGCQALAKVRERFETGVSLYGGIQEGREVVNSLQRPARADKVAFEVAFDGFLQEFHRTAANSARAADGIGGVEAFPAEHEPVVWIGFVCLHARRKPERTTSA